MMQPSIRTSALAALAMLAAPASAQTYPTRPVTIVTPFAAGSVTDANSDGSENP